MSDKKVFSLLQICTSIRKQIEQATAGRRFWVKAEIAGINAQKHVYLELAQHEEGARVAVMRGIIWQYHMRAIREALGGDLFNVLKEGSEILFLAAVQYNPVHGLSLHIEEVDLSYSLGALEQRKQATVETLRREGLYDMNRSVPTPLVIQRVALIASIGSAAYTDFVQHLAHNEYGYRFHIREFPSSVQGESAPQELRAALAAIDHELFDAVVIIRGGGSKLDLEAFNDLDLCRAVARMPIPVMTGIGHDVDVSVLDLIAHTPHKTPTAIADFLVDKCLYFETALNGFLVTVQRSMSEVFSSRKEQLSAYSEMTRSRPIARCQRERGDLQATASMVTRSVRDAIHVYDRGIASHANMLALLPLQKMKQVEAVRIRELRSALEQVAQRGLSMLLDRVQGMDQAIQLLAPERVLARGFTITRHKGGALKSSAGLKPGDEMETTFASGSVRSTITTTDDHG